jgi:stage V sporulation protein G
MEITEVKVFPINEEKLKAFVSIVFDQCFMVNDIKIIQGRDGLFISMPSRKKKNGEFKDVAHPLNNETRRMIETKVLAEYERVLADRGERTPELSAAVAQRTEVGLASGATDTSVPASGIPAMPPVPGASGAPNAERTLEEVEEIHLRDSFWTA